jgi:hypothetical protein
LEDEVRSWLNRNILPLRRALATSDETKLARVAPRRSPNRTEISLLQ